MGEVMLCRGIVKDNVVTLPPEVALRDETEVTVVIHQGKPNAMDVFQLSSAAAKQVWDNAIDEAVYKDVDWRKGDE